MLLAVLALVVLSGTALAGEHAVSEESFLDKINEERSSQGLDPLVVDVETTRVARGWTAEMASSDTLKHNPSYSRQIKADWSRLGENVGYSRLSGASEEDLVKRLHRAFMNSDGHRRNILGDWTQVGIGVTVTSANQMWVTVNFMKAPVPDESTLNTAVRASQEHFAEAQAGHVVLGRADVFADSLAGASLAGTDGPILLTSAPRSHDPSPVLHPRVRAEIDRVLGGSGTVYLLGGERAVSPRVADELARGDYEVERLSGEDRVATALAIAEEVATQHGDTGEVLLATAGDWPDAVTGGAYAAHEGVPVLLTGPEALDPRVETFLRDKRPDRVWGLGGPAALSDQLLLAAGADRVGGRDRHETSIAIAEQLWQRTESSPGTGFLSINGLVSTGWADALAQAPLSASSAQPQLLVSETVPASVASYLTSLGY